MPEFIKLTPKNNVYKKVFINCCAIESIFEMNEGGAHINFPSSYLEVVESAESVINLVNRQTIASIAVRS